MTSKPCWTRRATAFGLAAGFGMAVLPHSPLRLQAASFRPQSLTPELASSIRRLERFAGRPMPAFEDRIVIISFFASWCAPCIDEFAYLRSIYNAYGGEDPVIVAINLHETWAGDSDPTRLRRFIDRTRPIFTVVRGNDAVADAFGGVRQIPSLFLFDRDGDLAYSFLNSPKNAISENTEAQLHAVLSKLL
jgi:thiol-disulfide isomerase/thioredoxin